MVRTGVWFVLLLVTLVPSNAAGQSKRAAAGSQARVVSPPPAALNLPAFFQKYVDAGGIQIVASAKVPDEALLDTRRWVTTMLGRNAPVRAAI